MASYMRLDRYCHLDGGGVLSTQTASIRPVCHLRRCLRLHHAEKAQCDIGCRPCIAPQAITA